MRKLIAVVALATLAACGSDSSTSATSIEGKWSLNAVNGAPLPFTYYQTSTEKGEVLGDTFTASGGKAYFATTYRYTVTGSPVQTETTYDTATYTISGNTVKFKYSASDSMVATWSGNSLTASDQGLTAVYLKQ